MSRSLERLASALAAFATVVLISGTLPAAPARAEEDAPPVVTGDIQAGIEKHIDEQIAQGDGYFTVEFEGETLKLQLVRVHLEYLATLGPHSHFACVDMASSDGQFYDIDFFLEGDPGTMSVTETTVHKLNGRPYYLWEQDETETWVRRPVADAGDKLLGVVSGTDSFEFRYQATVPPLDGPARCWIPLAESDRFQTVTLRSIDVPGQWRTLVDEAHGNHVLYLELLPEDSGRLVEIVYDVIRREKSAYEGDPIEARKYLAAERMVPSDPTLVATAEKAVTGRDSDLMRARALYDLVIDQMQYKKFGEGWGQGDAVFACNSLYGNCTDYHAYFIGLARAVGIPARFAIGASIPSARDEGGTDGYHCWAEFYANGKWWPVDISEADKFSALSMYFFGHHPANRFELSHGRDLVLDPGPVSGPINFLAYPVLEVDGVPQKMAHRFLFKRSGWALAD